MNSIKPWRFLKLSLMRIMKQRIGEIRSFADALDAVRFNRNKINRQLSKPNLASLALEHEVIWLGRSR